MLTLTVATYQQVHGEIQFSSLSKNTGNMMNGFHSPMVVLVPLKLMQHRVCLEVYVV